MTYEIYLIENDGFWYVGSTTVGYLKRWETRHAKARGGARLLSEKILELGAEVFRVSLLETGTGDPIPAERKWYKWYLANDPRQTLNGGPPGWPNTTGQVFSPEARAKMSAAQKGHPGRPHTPESKAKIAASNRRRTISEETRKKHSDAARRQMEDPVRRAKALEALNSPESKIKRDIRNTGRPRGPRTPEWRQHMSEALKGREITPEWRAKLSAASKAVPLHQCGNCSKQFKPWHMSRHQKSSGHQGRITLQERG